MDLFLVSAGTVSAINPRTLVAIQISIGSTPSGGAGSRLPQYAPPIRRMAQLQRLQYTDLVQVADAGLNMQGVRMKIYVWGQIEGLVRVENKGGDLVTWPNDGSQWANTVWKVGMTLEAFPNYTCALVTLQDVLGPPAVTDQSGQPVTDQSGQPVTMSQ